MRRVCSLVSPFVNHDSIAKTGRNLVDILYRMNANFTTFDISNYFDSIPTKKDKKLIKTLNKTAISELSNEKNIVFNADLEMMRQYEFKYDYIPYFSLDTNAIPKEYINILKDKESIFVYNNFTKNILQECALQSNIVVIPPSINSRIYKNPTAFGINGKCPFAFLSIVDVEKDLNWIDVVRSFYASFKLEDEVCLVIKANTKYYSKYYQESIAREIYFEKQKYQKSLPPIILISVPLSDEEMASLYSECNCYVKISGVNSGLSFIEAFASGLVCIGPEQGGCKEILNSKTGFMVKRSGEKRIFNETLSDGIIYNTYSEEHLSEIMRWVFDNSTNLKEKTVKERKIVLSRFDCNVVGQSFLKSLR